ncbi:MAG: hypothetical protein H8F28_20000 [Fibrella sp.]|nr:hypothetical protein [Armatimonadota bacterium]
MTLMTADGETNLAVNDSVRLVRFPRCWESSIGKPEFADSVALVRRCVGNVYRVDGFDKWGQVEINVYEDGTQAPNYCYHTLWLESEDLRKVTP